MAQIERGRKKDLTVPTNPNLGANKEARVHYCGSLLLHWPALNRGGGKGFHGPNPNLGAKEWTLWSFLPHWPALNREGGKGFHGANPNLGAKEWTLWPLLLH